MASSHAEEMARRCTGGKAPRLAQHFYRHVRDSDGHLTLRYWSGAESSLAPLYSFQFYVTYDMSGAANSELEALARELMCRIPDGTWDPGAIHARLDVHFLGCGASTEDCVAHYRRFKDNPPDGPSMRIIPSYFSESYCHHHCLFFKIEDPNWKDDEIGLKRVEFDHKESGRPDAEEENITTGEAAVLCGNVYLMPHHDGNFRDECEGLYQAAVKAGLNEWTSDPFSRPVNLMDTSPVDVMASPAALPPRQINLDRHFRYLQAHDGHLVLSVWAGCSLPPLYSFQFYVTYDLSGVENSGFEALARRLHERILDDDMASKPIRFDVHLVGPQATIEDCIALYRHSKENPPSDPSARVVASYNRDDDWSYHSHLLIISKTKWEDRVGGGMRRVSFDPVESKRVANHRPTLKRWSVLYEVSGFCKDVYESVGTPAGCIREEREAAYDAAKEKGLTEW
ncbi:uncharacterized protein J3D65DRAFT_673811 [Phyllosticta citribraziliensis]|uniref:Uncharacterized protein n=1 Tax=Phyllosticta citribraziliensis TaxID=989973 RepID=A0ABR1MD45_9PEZI